MAYVKILSYTYKHSSPNISYEMRRSMKPLKSKVSIALDSDIIESIKQLAEQDDRSFSQYINLVLKDHLDRRSANERKE